MYASQSRITKVHTAIRFSQQEISINVTKKHLYTWTICFSYIVRKFYVFTGLVFASARFIIRGSDPNDCLNAKGESKKQ